MAEKRSIRQLAQVIEEGMAEVLTSAEIPRLPDSRAVGSAVQQELLDHWDDLASRWGVDPQPTPGPKTMYDGALMVDGTFVGIDFSAKRSGEAGYSDGGICSVADLLRFLVRSRGWFLIAQVRYETLDADTTISSVRVAPLHCLPLDDFAIANLGTGQVRLKRALDASWDEIAWDRTPVEFLEHFASLAANFYEAGAELMLTRRNAIQQMVESGFSEVRIK